MLKSLIYKLGQNPTKSWAEFKLGLFVFVVGVVLIFAGARFWIWLQIPAILLLAAGFLIAGKGYIGIFSNRFAQTLNRLSPPDEPDK